MDRRAVRIVLLGLALVLGLLIAPASPASASKLPAPKILQPANHAVRNAPILQWSRINGATEYRLEIAYDHDFTKMYQTFDTPATRYINSESWPASSFWWRVRALKSVPGSAALQEGQWSRLSQFTRRWITPDGDGKGDKEGARPDKVEAEDFDPNTPGYQVPWNAVKIWWEPVADASRYQVVFWKEGQSSETGKMCETVHTILTPSVGMDWLPFPIAPGICEVPFEPGENWRVIVRAIDTRPESGEPFNPSAQPVDNVCRGEGYVCSLWSDEARNTEVGRPGIRTLHIQGPLQGTATGGPAKQVHPADRSSWITTPLFQWEPVAGAMGYYGEVALDKDFTSVVGTFSSTNTRMMPQEIFFDYTAERSYYWFVTPCYRQLNVPPRCVDRRDAINRTGQFRTFKLEAIPTKLRSAQTHRTPWYTFKWESTTEATWKLLKKIKPDFESFAGIKGYQIQTRLKGTPWGDPEATAYQTDLPQLQDLSLDFDRKYEWRVRWVDETGDTRPWSETRYVKTPVALAKKPYAVRYYYRNGKLQVNWDKPYSRFFPIDSYTVYYSRKGKRWRTLGSVIPSKATFNVAKKQRFYLIVTASNYAGESRPSSKIVVRT